MKHSPDRFWSRHSHFFSQNFSTMSILTFWQQRMLLSLAFFASFFWQTARACDVIVAGGQPVVVHIFLDPINGTSTLSGANIMAFVQGSGPGCSEYQFYESPDKSTWIGTTVGFSCSDASTSPYSFIVRMDDFDGDPDNGNESSPVLLSVFVHDATSPSLTCPGNTTVFSDADGNEDCVMDFAPGAIDLVYIENCPDFVGFKLSGATVTNGFVAGTDAGIIDFNKGITTVTYKVEDVAGHVVQCSFTVTVNDGNAPELNNLPNNLDTVYCGGDFAETLNNYWPVDPNGVTAIDSCDGVRPVTYSIVVDSFSYLNCIIPYQITRTWQASDASGNVVISTSILSVIDTLPPDISGIPQDSIILTPADDATECDAFFELDVLDFTGDCVPNDSLSVDLWVNGFAAATFTGFYVVQSAPHELVYAVTDPCGYSTRDTLLLFVQDAAPPVAACITTLNLALNPLGTVVVVPALVNQNSFDNCTPQGDLLFDVFPTHFDCSHVGLINQVTLTVIDTAGNFSTCISEIDIQDNTAPALVCPANATFDCAVDESVAGLATATDACGVASLDYNETVASFTGPHCFVLEREWKAIDVNQNEAVCYQYLTVQDTAAPVLYGIPGDTVLFCGDPLPAYIVTAVDDCSGTWLVLPSIDTLPGADCLNNQIKYYVVRTWSTVDSCGNPNVTIQTIAFKDTLPADASAVPTSFVFYTDPTECEAAFAVDLTDYNIFDGCAGGIVTLAPATFSDILPVGDYQYNFTTQDECGNFGYHEFFVQIRDSISPQVVCQTEITVALNNAGIYTLQQGDLLISANDNCGVNNVGIFPAFVSCADANLEELGFGPVTVSLLVTDFSGNLTVCPVFVHTISDPATDIQIDDLLTTDVSFYGAADGTATIVSASGGSGDYAYTFFDDDGDAFDFDSLTDNLAPGFYFAGVQDNQTSCLDLVTFLIFEGPLPHFMADTVAGPAGDTICVPITVAYFKNIVGVELEINVPDIAVGKVLAVENWQPGDFSLAVSQPISNNFVVSMLSPNLTEVDLNDGDTLFVLKIELTGDLFDTTAVDIIDGSVEVTVGPGPNFTQLGSTHSDGFVAINSGQPDVEVAGEIRAWWGPTVALVEVDLNGGQDQQTTASDGQYSFSINNASPAVITPSKDINYGNGVDALDLLTIQAHILGDVNSIGSNPYKLLAGDANNDQKVTTFDLVELLNVILNQVDLATNTSWRFVPADFVFPDPADPWAAPFPESIDLGLVLADTLENDFMAIKIGDVLGNADTDMLLSVDDRSPFVFKTDDRSVSTGERVDLAIRASDFRDRHGWQLTLEFETELVDFQGITPGELPGLGLQNFGNARLADGFLTTAWTTAQPLNLPDETVLFTLHFTAKQAISSLENVVEIGNAVIPSFGINGQKSPVKPQLVWAKNQSNLPSANAEFALFQNRPNPFSDRTTIHFTLPTAAETTFSMFDITGKLVKSETSIREKGRHEISVRRVDLPTAGVYFYEIRTAENSARRRLILID